jgi:hypothetical protein
MSERFDGERHAVDDAAAAAELVPGLLRPHDVVLIKGSRGVGLELVCRALGAGAPAPHAASGRPGAPAPHTASNRAGAPAS